MANYLKPKRGRRSTAEEQNIILKRGEVFFECPETGQGTGTGRIKVGDGTTAYRSLPYFINPDNFISDISTANVSFTETSETNNTTLLSKIVSGAALNIITASTKNLFVNIITDIAQMKENFQDGVDSIYDACVAKGSTPSSTSLSDVVQGIMDIQTGIIPTGTINITSNGTKDVTQYASASVNVPASAVVSGTINITSNGTKDVTNYKSASVQVPASAVVSGTKSITTNGTTDVTNYASANVNVPASAVVSGTKNITTNGTVDVTNYKNASVAVPASAVTSGTYTYPSGSTGGTVDVTQYKNANAANVYNKGVADGRSLSSQSLSWTVPEGASRYESHTFTFSFETKVVGVTKIRSGINSSYPDYNIWHGVPCLDISGKTVTITVNGTDMPNERIDITAVGY